MRSAIKLQDVIVDAAVLTCSRAPVWMSRLREASAAVIAEGERWQVRAGELYDDLRREQDAHLALVTATREQRGDLDEYEERQQHAAGSIDQADEEIVRLREELHTAREQIDELLAQSSQ